MKYQIEQKTIERVHIEGQDFKVTTWKAPNEWEWAYEGKTDTEGVHATQLKALAAAPRDAAQQGLGSGNRHLVNISGVVRRSLLLPHPPHPGVIV